LLQIADGLGNLAERVGAVDDRRDLAGEEKITQHGEVVPVRLGTEATALSLSP
jgi:hypothetical protein